MSKGGDSFIFKAVLLLVLACIALYLLDASVQKLTGRFGNPGWIAIIIGVLVLVVGTVVAWATVITGLDRRALRRYRADPEVAFHSGQIVALSGRIRVEGAPLVAPFSGQACAAYRYQLTAQRRNVGPDNQTRQQLCLLGFALAEARLECGTRSFPIQAIPDVDTDLRSIATGGEWGDRGLERIRDAEKHAQQVGEPHARDALSAACKFVQPPQSEDLFVAPTRAAGPEVSVTEDAVPIGEPVTILAAYDARTDGLDGKRWGGLKAFSGPLDQRLAVLDQEWRKGLQFGLLLLAAGLALLTMASWWPG